MNKHILLVVWVVVAVTSCSDKGGEVEPSFRELTTTELQVAAANNDFAFNLFREANKSENAFISPLSVGIALAMTMNGASPETQESIISTINFGGLSASEVNEAYRELTKMLLSMDRKVKLGLANSIWTDDDVTIQKTFAEIVDENYNARATSLNFANPQSKETINKWVESKTNGKIKNLLEAISPDEVMFLINAIYFKADWTYQFDKTETHTAPFKRDDNSTTDVEMMRVAEAEVRLLSDDNITLVDVPYGNGEFTFTILMSDTQSPPEIMDWLNSQQLDYMIQQASSRVVQLELPKFTMTWKNDLLEILTSMGMQAHGFPGLIEENVPLAISRVTHQSFIEVNEEGSEAAAATAVGVYVTSLPPTPPTITVDKPFIFLIQNKHTKSILFIGQLLDPAQL